MELLLLTAGLFALQSPDELIHFVGIIDVAFAGLLLALNLANGLTEWLTNG